MSYRIDARSHNELIEALEERAKTVEMPHVERLMPDEPVFWSTALSDDPVSASLLHELLRGHHSLLDHAATLPSRAARYWLEQTCGIAALAPAPATAVVVAEVADDAGPLLAEAGTTLKGPKDANGQATTFTTDDHLVATGSTVLGVRSHGRWVDRDAAASSDGGPVAPFADEVAQHELYFCSDALRFDGGTLDVDLDFSRTGIDVSTLAGLRWEHSHVDGSAKVSATVASTTRISLRMAGGCHLQPAPTEDGDLDHYWLRASTDEFDSTVLAFAFDAVTITVTRSGLAPDSAWYNDGSLDTEREFNPFGDVPRRGDSFFVQSDEAFAKSLDNFTVHLAPLNSSEYRVYLAALFPDPQQIGFLRETQQLRAGVVTEEAASIETVAAGETPAPSGGFSASGTLQTPTEPSGPTHGGPVLGFPTSDVAPTIDWQIRDDASWRTLASKTVLNTASNLRPERAGEPASDQISLGGVDGHFARAFLSAGDFGWDAYQQGLIDFANFVAQVTTAEAAFPTAPTPPTMRYVTISYTSTAMAPDRIVSVNGHHRRTLTDGVPFAHPITTQVGTTPAGSILVGLDLPDAALGQTLSTWFQVDSTAACVPSTGEDLSRWEFWNGLGWTRVAASDGSSQLRTSGLVRFVTPLDWPTGCPEAGTTNGRWFRLATNQPDRIGTIEAVFPDAVLATALPGPTGAVAALAAPEPESVKGPKVRIAGLKKLVNPLVGLASRAAETDEHYLRRAPQVIRTRNRLVQPTDYELDIRANFAEVAFVAALPHFDGTDDIAPGHVGIVVIPTSTDPDPLPSADLVARIEDSVVDRAPVHATVAVHCPSYERVGVDARIVLAPGVAALTARSQLADAIDEWLHPLNREADALGRPLYRSELIVLLEGMAIVDRIESIDLNVAASGIAAVGPTGLIERVDPPSPRRLGMVVSSGSHELELQERLA